MSDSTLLERIAKILTTNWSAIPPEQRPVEGTADWHIDQMEALCQEVARETLESLLDSELANTCVCQLADAAVCDHNWSLCNEIRQRLELTQKPAEETEGQ